MKLYLIGGGASLTKHAINLLKEEQKKGHKLFGCNHAYRFFDLDYLIYLDTSLYSGDMETIDRMRCEVFTRCAKRPQRANLITMAENYRHGNPVESGVYGGGSKHLLSGIAGISIALSLGYTEIYLVGYDGGYFEGQSHIYHKNHKAERYEVRNHKFEPFRGRNIINCNLKSNIDIFPKIALEDVVNDYKKEDDMKKTIRVQSYFGFGDQIQMRPFILGLKKKYEEVYLVTPYPDILYHGTDVKCLAPQTKLKNQKEWTEKNEKKYHKELPRYDRKIRPDYGSYIRNRKQAIFKSFNEQMPICLPYQLKEQDFSFPIKKSWVTKAKKMLPDTQGKKLCVLKLPTLRAEWQNKSRNPLMKYFQQAIDILKDEFYFISVADLRGGLEWLSEDMPNGIDFCAHNAEFELDALIGLLSIADLTITCPSNFNHICACNNYPCFIIYGGSAPDYIYREPLTPSKYGFIEPDEFCFCFDNDHKCNKEIDKHRFEDTLVNHVTLLHPEVKLYKKKRVLLVSRMEHFRAKDIMDRVKEQFDVVTICHTPLELYQQHDFKASYKYVNNKPNDCYSQIKQIIKDNDITHALISQIGSIQGDATAKACLEDNVRIAWGERFFDDRIIVDFTALQYRDNNDIKKHVGFHRNKKIIKPRTNREYQPELVEAYELYDKYKVDRENTVVFLAQLCYDEAVKQSASIHINGYYHFIESLLIRNPNTQFLFKYHPKEKEHNLHRRFENEFKNVIVCEESLDSLFSAFDYFASFSSTTIFEGVLRGKRFATGGFHLCQDPRLTLSITRPEWATKLIEKLKTRLVIDDEYRKLHLSFITTKYTVSIKSKEILDKLLLRNNYY